jgi:hypothetical protein
MLPDVGSDAFRNDPAYVDNGLAEGEFDVPGRSLTLRYEDGTAFELTAWVSWNDLVEQIKPAGGGGTIYTYYKLKPPQPELILPRRFDKVSAPNVAAMVADIAEALPGAEAGLVLGRILLDFVQLGPRPLGGPNVPGTPVPLVRPRRMRLGGQAKKPVDISASRFLESEGASPRGPQFQSASARANRAVITSIRADVAESEAYKAALLKGEIGLQRPQGANLPGSDYITAARNPGGQIEVIVTDVKMSTVGKFPSPRAGVPATWRAEVQSAVAPGRLRLGDAALEQEIRAAVASGRIRSRQVNVDYSPTGQGQINGL